MSKLPDFNLELSEMLYNDNTGSMIMNPEQKYQVFKFICLSIWNKIEY